MLHLAAVVLKRGEQVVFDGASLTVHPGHAVGVAGRNGAGKTTLFDLILGRLLPEAGDVSRPRSWRAAWLEQNIAPSPRGALDFAVDGDRRLRKVEAAIAAAHERNDGDALARLYGELEDAGGYDANARGGEILHGLGFAGEDFDKPHQAFSGGWRIRLNLARALMAPADLLLLDEPTNHLDLDAVLWLEAWLRRFAGTLLVISHDRDFLDAVCGQVAHVNEGGITLYSGNYSAFERQRAETLARQAANHERQRREIEHMQRFIDRFRYKESKARQAQSRLKALERMERVAPVRAETPYRFAFANPAKATRPLVSMDAAALGYDGAAVLEDVTLRVYPGDRIGILGVNGAGKSTLLKALAGALPPLAGDIERGQHSAVGYFAQHQMERLDGERTALATVQAANVNLTEQAARNYLGRWGFGRAMIERPAATLSGGERARLVLALIANAEPALLMLDEPTNHLDMDMREALALALQGYEGALLLVSHDRHLLRECVDELWLAADRRVRRFRGSLEDYAARVMQGAPARVESATARRPERSRRRKTAAQREQLRPLAARLAGIERSMEAMTAELQALEQTLANGADPAPRTPPIGELLARQGRLRKRLAAAEDDWLAVQERIEAATGARDG